MKIKCGRILMALAVVLCLCTQALATPEALVPVGRTVGIHLCGDLVVVGFDEQTGAQARSAGVRVGDRIVSVNGVAADSLQTLRTAADEDGGVHLTVEREGKPVEFYLTPVQTSEGGRIGLKVRDGITGIGTVTFYDPETGACGALGHSVNDPASGVPIPTSGGSFMAASVTEVVRGRPGDPGELRGAFSRDDTVGEIRVNEPAGLFGTIQPPDGCGAPIPVADAAEVETARAAILSNVSGTEVQSYAVEIQRIDPDNREGRNFLIHVCDEDLIAQTGGIVQGMSGSPIIQNGRLVGAVTHVLVDDPTRGYGILIGNMLDAAA